MGENQISAQAVVQRLVAGLGGEEGAAEDIAETQVPTKPRRPRTTPDPGVVVTGVSDVWIKLARCCTPVPGDEVFGFVTRTGGVSVHRTDCANATDLRKQPERIVEVTWKPTSASTFLVAIQVEALDRHKLLADITQALSEERSTSSRPRSPPPGTGSRSAASRSRWPIRSTSATCWRR